MRGVGSDTDCSRTRCFDNLTWWDHRSALDGSAIEPYLRGVGASSSTAFIVRCCYHGPSTIHHPPSIPITYDLSPIIHHPTRSPITQNLLSVLNHPISLIHHCNDHPQSFMILNHQSSASIINHHHQNQNFSTCPHNHLVLGKSCSLPRVSFTAPRLMMLSSCNSLTPLLPTTNHHQPSLPLMHHSRHRCCGHHRIHLLRHCHHRRSGLAFERTGYGFVQLWDSTAHDPQLVRRAQ